MCTTMSPVDMARSLVPAKSGPMRQWVTMEALASITSGAEGGV